MRISVLPFLMFVSGLLSAQDRPDTLIFSHKLHVKDVGSACLDCHAAITESTTEKPAGLPSMQVCGTCHDETENTEKCGLCHTSPDNAAVTVLKLTYDKFKHADHLKEQSDCLFCHKGADQAIKLHPAKIPSMTLCMTCHNDKRAPQACNTCHANINDLRPATHGNRWLSRNSHGFAARFDKPLCNQCHRDTDCEACHLGQRSTRIHTPDYRYTHGYDARVRDKNCALCHERVHQCRTCH